MNNKVGRNDPCPCGSGKKYKSCCITKERKVTGPRKFTAKLLSQPKSVNLIERTFGQSIEAANRGPKAAEPETPPTE